MRCREVRSVLESFLSGELSGIRAVAFTRHLDACPTCRKEMEVTRRLLAELHSSLQVVTPSRSFLLSNLAIQPQRLSWFPKAASITILSALLLGLILTPNILPSGHETPVASFQTSPASAQQSTSREATEVMNRHGTDWRISIN